MTKILPFQETTDPAAIPDNLVVYAKDVAGVTQLFGRASDGTIYQLTPTGIDVQTAGVDVDPPSADYNFLGIALTADGQFGYVGNQNTGENRPVWKFRVADNMWVGPIACGDAPSYVTTADIANKAYVSNFSSGSVSVIDMTTDTVIATIPGFTQPVVLDATPDNSTVYVCDYLANAVIRIDVATDTIVGAPIAVTGPISLKISPDGLKVYVARTSGIDVISTVSNTITASIGGLAAPNDIVFKPDGTEAYVRDTGTTLRRINVATDSLTGAAIAMGSTILPGLAITTTGIPKVYATTANGDVLAVSTVTNLVVATIAGVGQPNGLQRLDALGTDVFITQFGFFGPATVFRVDSVTDTVVATISGIDPAPPTDLGRFSTMRFAGLVVADEGGGVVSVTAVAGGYAFVFQPGGTQEANVYTDWNDLMAALGAVLGPKLLQFDDQFSSITIPAGTWDMTDTVWEGVDRNAASSLGSTLVTFDDGVEIIRLRTVRGLRLDSIGTTPPISDLADGDVFTLDDYAVIGGLNNPVIDLSAVEEFKTVTISVRHGSQILQQPLAITGLDNGGLIIDVDSASLLEANTVAGTSGSLSLKLSRVSPNGGYLQSFFTGGINLENSLGGFNLQPESLSQLFGGTLNYFSLGGAVNANLTPANWQPGAIVVVKNTSGSGTVTINPSGSDTIDGAATYVITTGQGSVILVSDGVSNWMIIGEKV